MAVRRRHDGTDEGSARLPSVCGRRHVPGHARRHECRRCSGPVLDPARGGTSSRRGRTADHRRPERPQPAKLPAYSRVASKAAGASRSVICWSAADWAILQPAFDEQGTGGFVDPAKPRQINLAPQTCSRLDRIEYRRPMPPPATSTAVAVLVFASGIEQSRGYVSLAQITCYGLQLVPDTSERLGACRVRRPARPGGCGVVQPEQPPGRALVAAVPRRRQARPRPGQQALAVTRARACERGGCSA